MKKLILLLLLFAFGYSSFIESVILTKDGKIEVITIRPSPFVYPEGGQLPGEVIKKIYKSIGDKIILEKEIKGIYYPEATQTIPSRIEWSEK